MSHINKILFISDLHLDKLRDDIEQNFERFICYCLREHKTIEAVFILGDLFDFWFGDDASITLNQNIIEQLKKLTSAGVSVFIMHGNRDFLINDAFAKATGCQLIDDPYLLSLNNETILLAHGDQLCTDDIEYQQFKQVVRDPATIKTFLQKPITERIAITNAIKSESQKSAQEKSKEIMDVNQQAVISFMRKYKVKTLIHGHTHRPDIHSFTIDGQTFKRYVLSDWDTQGSYLEWDGQDLKMSVITD